MDAVYAQRVGGGEGIENLKLVYTPLNGAGLECIRMLAKKLGVKNMTVVPEQEQPDGNFPTCPYPNPEIRQAMQKGLELCEKVKPDLLLGTDPDCDRCGTAVPDHKGGYRLISGNEMGVICWTISARAASRTVTCPEKPVAVTTIVSTDMVDAVAERYGVELRRVLTGFKFIGRADRKPRGGWRRSPVHFRLRGELRLPFRHTCTRQGRSQRVASHHGGCRLLCAEGHEPRRRDRQSV